MVGRPHGTSQSADADRHLVVIIHGSDGLGQEPLVSGCRASPFWSWRSRLLSQPDKGIYDLAASGRTSAGARHHVDEFTLGRSLYASPGRVHVQLHELAPDV